MKRVCRACKAPREDVVAYTIKSVEKSHTYWDIDLCIDCRDKALDFITAMINNNLSHRAATK